MSLILVGLLLPLERASSHCQGQTLSQYFLSRVKTHLFSAVFSPPQLPPHQLFLSSSFPFLFPTPVCYSLPWHCPLISYPAPYVGAGAQTHKKKKRKKKTRPCYHDLLEMHLVVSSFSFQILVMPVL